jgi:hypothetical protein
MSSVSNLKSGRTVNLHVDGGWGYSVADSMDSTTIEVAGHAITVAPTQLVMDGKSLARIDKNAKNVAINVSKGELTFDADGVRVATLYR